MKYVFGGGLVLIIVGSLVLTVHYGLRGDRASSARSGQQIHFKCDECGHEFAVDIREVGGPGTYEGARMDCPACGAKAAGLSMLKCPNCGKYYVPDTHRDPTAIVADSQVRDVCPHCGTDRFEWYDRKHRKNR